MMPITQEGLIFLVHRWQSRLGLDDWQIAIVFKDEPPTVNEHLCHMKIHRSHYYRRATLEVSAACLDPTLLPDCIERDLILNGTLSHTEYVQVSTVHELLHLILRDLMRSLEMVDQELHPGVRSLLNEAQQQAEEATVEHLAEALVHNWELVE